MPMLQSGSNPSCLSEVRASWTIKFCKCIQQGVQTEVGFIGTYSGKKETTGRSGLHESGDSHKWHVTKFGK